MKYFFINFFLLISTFKCISQQQNIKEVDSLYKEDQFYAGVTYNLLGNKPKDISQNGFSFGFHIGLIKDIPINKRRNIALGIGLGYSTNSFNQNLLIEKENEIITYSALENPDTFTKNKFLNHVIELPFEFRWRTSTPSEYNFWRIYTGFKIGYVIAHNAKYNGDLGNLNSNDIEDYNKFQYGCTISLGYNTWNLYLYYGLNTMFSNKAVLNSESIDINVIKLGLMFYVL